MSASEKIAGPLVASALNQAVSSGGNFLFGLFLIRALSPIEFGLFAIGFSISLFYAGIGNAMFLVQMVVHTPDKLPRDRRLFATRILVLTMIFCATTLAVCAVGFVSFQLSTTNTNDFAVYSQSIAFASTSFLLKEFFVRYAYNIAKPALALAINSFVVVSYLSVLLLPHVHLPELSATFALFIYAFSNVVGAICGWTLTNLKILDVSRSALLAEVKTIWHGGTWASITSVLEFLRAQSNIIITAILLGPVSVAKMNAARLLVTPVMMLTPAITQVAMPRLASIDRQNPKRITSAGLAIGVCLLLAASVYCSMLMVWHGHAVTLLLDDRYADLLLITLLWSIYACVFSLKGGLEIALQVLHQFRQLTVMKAITAVVSLVATYVLTIKFGLVGALGGLLVGEILLVIFMFAVSRICVGAKTEPD